MNWTNIPFVLVTIVFYLMLDKIMKVVEEIRESIQEEARKKM